MYVGKIDITHKECWGSDTSKTLALKGLCLKVILKNITERSYELFAFCRKDNNQLPKQTELNFTISTLSNYHTVQRCELLNAGLGLLDLTIVDTVGTKGIIRDIRTIEGVDLLEFFGTWVFDNGIEKYWMLFKDSDSYSAVLKRLEKDDCVKINNTELIDVSAIPPHFISLPNYLSTAIEILDIDESIKDAISYPLQEHIFKTASTRVIDAFEIEDVINKIDEHEKKTEITYLVLRLLTEAMLRYIP